MLLNRHIKILLEKNTSNHHINQALRKAGIKSSIGKEGYKMVLKDISDFSGIKALNYNLQAIFDLVFGVIF